jgi:curved DNA-binding protein CbpA
MKDFGGAGLRFDFLDDIFGDLLKGRGSSFSFRSGRPGRVRFEVWPGQEINLGEIFGQTHRPQAAHYELTISQEEALQGVKKILKRSRKRLEVRIPAGVRTGDVVRYRNALQTSDGSLGDILIKVIVK